MTDYIKRTDAVKIAEKYGLANGSVLGRHTGLADCIARDISELPAADVADMRKEIEWKDMVIALTQRKQAEAEAERDALLEYAKLFTGCDTCRHSNYSFRRLQRREKKN